MSNFEYYLQDIASDISSPNDSIDYSDFVTIKDYVLDMMRRESPYFNKICQNDMLFGKLPFFWPSVPWHLTVLLFVLAGSVAQNIRLHNDNEYDVLMELHFPKYHLIAQCPDNQRPGFVFLDFEDACCDNMIALQLANNQQSLLDRTCLQGWLYGIFKKALNNNGNVVNTGYDEFTLKLWWRDITYTIIAESPSRRFTIDFVPAVKIVRHQSNFNTKKWHAIPKQKKRPGNMNNFTFMLSNTVGELQHVERCGEAMRDALRLMQALRDNRGLHKLRGVHMVTVAIWMARRIGHSNVMNMSVSAIFLTVSLLFVVLSIFIDICTCVSWVLLQLLNDLCDAFNDRHLSFVWDVNLNLFENFLAADITRYGNELCHAYNTLNSYQHQPNLRYGRCLAHFQ